MSRPTSPNEARREAVLPPGQHLAAAHKWPLVGERAAAAASGPWTVEIGGLVERPRVWSLEALLAMPRSERAIDVHCVTRWSKLAMRFGGVPLAELLAVAAPQGGARFVSFVAQSDRGHNTSLPLAEALELDVLVALEAEGAPLPAEHGGPVRVVTPGRYFYKSLKWLRRIELLAEDRLGYWEANAGYHNRADPWREERFLAANLTRGAMREVLASRRCAGRDLRSIDAAGHALEGLDARGALLRNANFRGARLAGADFGGANLSNAHFADADLRGARFSGADVEGADFSGADLRGADLRGTSLIGATFLVDERRARIDAATKFSPETLDDLSPEQAAFVRRGLAGGS